jgi:hypothetical protein
MVRTRDRSQCLAVAVPCAWKARRRGCEGDSRGGSVVLQSPVQRMSSLYTDASYLTHATGIEGTKSFSAAYPSSGHARDRRGGSLSFS